jgi:hypothetical protein
LRRNSKRYDLPNGRLSDNAALIASINGPSFGGFASISTLTASLRSATLHTVPIEATSVRPRLCLSDASSPSYCATAKTLAFLDLSLRWTKLCLM